MSELQWVETTDGELRGYTNSQQLDTLHAIIKYPHSRGPLVQFKGLRDGELHSGSWFKARDLETAKRICQNMMGAHTAAQAAGAHPARVGLRMPGVRERS